MEPQLLVQTSTGLFCLAATGGLLIAGMRLRGIPRPPAWLAMAHGLMAGAGLTLLLYAAIVVGVPDIVRLALALLLAAAAGGVAINLMYHVKAQPLPLPMVAGHGLLAATALVLLLVHQFRV